MKENLLFLTSRSILKLFLVASTLNLGACATGQVVDPTPDVVATGVLAVCPEPRPQVCTMDYQPVCAQMQDSSFKTYSNGCVSCADPDVVGYRDGNCESVQADDQAVQSRKPETTRTYVFTCADDFTFVARTEGGKAWLFLPSGTQELSKENSATYSSADMLFRVEGESSLLEEPGGRHPECRNNRRQAIWEHAKLNGADFRAVGNEPGWNLEIRNQSKIVLVTGYGSEKHEFDLSAPEIDQEAGATLYKVDQDGQEMTLTIAGESCLDSMSGEEFESRVEVVFNGKTLRGCGWALH